MRQPKQEAVLRTYRGCGKKTRGKYATKHHFCRDEDIERYTREQALADQRKGLL